MLLVRSKVVSGNQKGSTNKSLPFWDKSAIG